jgi:hypothetical protein
MRVPEEPVCIHLFRQNPVFTSLHLKSPVHVVPFLYCTVTINFTSLAASRGWAPRLMASTASSEGSTRIMTSPSPGQRVKIHILCLI